jgi:SAM-dependent methyltransferase
MWIKITNELAENIHSVLDLGCGTGQFAECLSENRDGISYRGVDFSATAIQIARATNPSLDFSVKDLRDRNLFDNCPDAVVATEVLEHIDNDRALLDAVPAATWVVFSVPNFDDPGHVRYFDTTTDVEERYGPHLESLYVEWIRIPGTRFGYWLGAGRR